MNRPRFPRVHPAFLVVGCVVALLTAGVWRFASRRASPDEASPRPVAAVNEPGGIEPAPDPSSPPPEPDAVPRGPLAGATILSERWLDDPATSTQPRRLRLARLAQDGRLVRLVDRFHADPAGGAPILLGSEVMRADAILVSVPAGQSALEIATRLQAAGFTTEPVRAPDAVVCLHLAEVTLDAVPAAIAEVSARLPDLVAEPDFIRFPSQVVPNDYDTTRLWGLEKIEAPAAWTASTGSAEVVVAVIDSGISTTHPDLAANVWTNPGEIAGNAIDDDGNGFFNDLYGWNFVSDNATVTDTDGHGTHVAGTIGATGNNGTGVVGVNWNVRVMALRAGSETFADSALLNAMRYAILMRQRGVRLVAVNMSLGGLGFSASFRQELINARNAGIVTVAAAGNLGSSQPTADNDLVPVYPASYDVDGLIAVASSNQGDSLSSFSHYGATSVDLAAPGTAVLSTYTGGGYERIDGTSMAAPHVTGAVALVAAANPTLTALQLRARILDTVDPVPALAGRVVTGGRLNLRRAVSPSLLRPRVTITGGGAAAEVAVLDRPAIALALAAALQPDGGITPVATLVWSMEAGPQAAVFSATSGATTSVTFPVAGRYRVRVTATAGALQERDEIVVAVGSDTSVATGGLQAWWRFDDTGASTGDSSGNSRTGSVNAAVRSSTAVLGTAMEFNGSTSRVGFSTPALSRVTIAGWARATAQNSLTIFPRVVHMQEGLLFGGFETTNNDDGNFNTLKFTLDQAGSDVVWHSPPGTFHVGAWRHVAVSYDPSATHPAPVFYIDGVRQLTGTQTSTTVVTPTIGAGQGFIGDRGDGTRGWLGQLDEVRVYNRVLGDDEVVWMSREAAVQALADGTLAVGSTADPSAVPLSFAPATTAFGAPILVNPRWTDAEGTTVFGNTSATAATATFTTSGTHLVRFDATSSDGVHITRTISVDIEPATVAREGYYTGTTSGGGIWTLLVRSDGTGTYFSASSRGSFQRDFVIPESGIFAFTDRAGTTVVGRIFADGSVSGTIGGVDTFTGSRSMDGGGTADPARDGIYSGWVVDSGVRAAAQVERGRISIVVEEPGAHRATAGAIDTSGVFALAPGAGASFSGTAVGGRLDADIALPGMPARELVLLRDGANPARRLTNISVRGFVGTGDAVLIPGFVTGGGPLSVLVRGIGPGLVPLDVPPSLVLQQPRIILRHHSTVIRENTGWTLGGQTAGIIAANTLTGAFPLDPALPDSALTLPLTAQSYTVEVIGADGGTGVALAELYDARTGGETGVLLNISGRGFVGTGDNILIGGFVIEGDAPVLVLVRAAGPALPGLGVPGELAQPRLRVLRGSSELAASGPWGAGDSPATVAEAASRVGAFPFAEDSADAALLLFLPSGLYTAQVSGAGDTTGIGLLEIYRVDGL